LEIIIYIKGRDRDRGLLRCGYIFISLVSVFPLGGSHLFLESLGMHLVNDLAILIIIPCDLCHRTSLRDGPQLLGDRDAGHLKVLHSRRAFNL